MPGASEGPAHTGGQPVLAQPGTRAPDGGQEHRAPDADIGMRDARKARSSTAVLADRIASALVHHEPGWRLPRHTALARRYNATTTAVDAAITELASRHLVRQLPDGQVYRASPADYFIPLEGVPGLTSYVDPMGGQIACRSRQVSRRRVPEDVGRALGIASGESVCVLRLLWTADGEPAALSTTYLAGHFAVTGTGVQDASSEAAPLNVLPLTATLPEYQEEDGPHRAAWQPQALFVEMQQPPPSVARSLRLPPGQLAALVTVRFDDPDLGKPAAVTIAVLRPDLFRIVVESPAAPLARASEAGVSEAWTHASDDQEA